MQPQRIRTHGTALCFCMVLFSLQTQLNRIPEQTASHTHTHKTQYVPSNQALQWKTIKL
jgi:hypothetical protein